VFSNRDGGRYLVTSINHLHQKARTIVGLGKDFVIHSLRHTMLTRLGESGVDAFTIMRIAGHSSITMSQRCVHPTPEAVERAFERLQLSGTQGQIEPKLLLPPTKVPTAGKAAFVSHRRACSSTVEQGTHNPLVGGSNPSGPTNSPERTRTHPA
jgi:hypothetical protein